MALAALDVSPPPPLAKKPRGDGPPPEPMQVSGGEEVHDMATFLPALQPTVAPSPAEQPQPARISSPAAPQLVKQEGGDLSRRGRRVKKAQSEDVKKEPGEPMPQRCPLTITDPTVLTIRRQRDGQRMGWRIASAPGGVMTVARVAAGGPAHAAGVPLHCRLRTIGDRP
eukprot:gene6461-5155_t